MTLFVYLRSRKKPTLVIALPMVFLLIVTTWAGVRGLGQQIDQQNWVVVVFGGLFLLLEALVLLEARKVLFKGA